MSDGTGVTLIYVTAASVDDAMAIGRELVGSRLAACANVLAGMTSVYRWEGALQEDREAVLILKTRRELVDRVVERVKRLHAYDCPCVVALPIISGHRDFLNWIMNETAEPSETTE